MATANLSWPACGSVSTGQYLYYGKLLIATGTPISGTGWTLYTGAPLPNTTSSATITGLDDNVEYVFYIYCQCATSGTGPLAMQGPLIKYVCPTFSLVSPTYNGVNYTITVPPSANNSGSWIQTIYTVLKDSSNTNLLQQNIVNAPFQPTISSFFQSLTSSTNYNLEIVYANSSLSRQSGCPSVPFTTSAACVAPTITVSNITGTTFDVSWTPSTGGSFDILLNGSAVATGLTSTNGTYTVTGLTAATIYQIAVRLNCTTGGSAVSNTQNVTTANSSIPAVISVNQSSSVINNRKQLTMSFNFPTPTPAPLVIYFGQTYTLGTAGNPCNYYNGYDIFPIPNPGSNPTCGGGLSEPGFAPSGNLPWVINIPQGTTTYTTVADTIYTTAGTGPNVGSQNPGGFQYTPWSYITAAFASYITDIYIKINSPSGYSTNFTITPGLNTTGPAAITLHNV